MTEYFTNLMMMIYNMIVACFLFCSTVEGGLALQEAPDAAPALNALEVPSPMWSMVPRVLIVVWGAGVAYQFAPMAYPHPAWLFHLHTLFAAALVIVVVFAASAAVQARRLDPAPARASHLATHKWGMLTVLLFSVLGECCDFFSPI
jgi:hypothetical protein